MKVMVFVKASKESEAGEMPSTELLEAMGKFNEQLVNAGIMVDGGGSRQVPVVPGFGTPAQIEPSLTGHLPRQRNSSPGSGSGTSRHSKKRLTGPKNVQTR